MNTPVHNDGMEEFDVPYMDSEYEESEKNETKELLRVFFDNLRKCTEVYLFAEMPVQRRGSHSKADGKE